jgi:membrane associated rhomboid family serine protease
MGIYDRDYYREEPAPFAIRGPRTAVVLLIVINAVLYFTNGLFTNEANSITRALSADSASLTKPWMWWQLLTYGFAHDPKDFQHILFNMLGLFILGRDIEAKYGRNEFLRLYTVMVVAGGVVWTAGNLLAGRDGGTLVGASGAVVGVVVLYALNFPRRTLLLFFVLPMPAWVVGVLCVAGDLVGAVGANRFGSPQTAYTVHLAGAAFAGLYYYYGLNLGRLVPVRFSWAIFKRRPKLRVHDPGPDGGPASAKEMKLAKEVDRILAKIHSQGEGSMTRKERRIMENASREYQKKKRRADEP